MNLRLQRTSSNANCTQGSLVLPDGTVLHTLELPWLAAAASPGGRPDVSCVPPGVYQLKRHDTVKHPKSFALVNPELGVIHEPDPAYPYARTACLIHVANRTRDLEGCIGIGEGCGDCLLFDSRLGLRKFQDQVPWMEGHFLEIRDVTGA